MHSSVETTRRGTVAPAARRARAAVFATFALNGFLAAMWVVHIPVITDRTGVSHGTLGLLILVMAGSGIVGMQAAGPLADRFGSRTLVGAAVSWLVVAVSAPAWATGPIQLGIALALFGFGNGALDVSMNAQAVQVERVYGRPIMAAFHALFSCGGLVGSLAGAAAMHAGADIRASFAVAAVLGLLVMLASVPSLLPRPHATSHVEPAAAVAESAAAVPGHAAGHVVAVTESATARRGAGAATSGSRAGSDSAVRRRIRRWLPPKVLALAAIAFALLMAEGVANDWSALQTHEHLGVGDATAALSFGAFSIAMTVGRFTADRVSERFGRIAVVRWGSVLGAAGLAVIMASPWLPLSLAGWILAGLGLAGGVPQIFTAAGNLGTATAATDMSKVFGLGYLGFLAGPSVIGWLAQLTSLTLAFTFPLIAVLLCAWFAGTVGDTNRVVDLEDKNS
ncbi:MFS transporter [Nocardia africana]|uniref:Inner membrane protein ybjJ n=1 Tax=Nocardia africana TaxID=134964 RepID=A0A378WMB9_9NOCA|nr:MFS transporter [Nocardia africana]MCC3315613.1 MFS transporter [Nocardia africana]SUA42072.1 Inner membrane protein ybjJ [Nocardia africana]